MMVSVCAIFFPRGVLDEILNLIESDSEGFPFYSFIVFIPGHCLSYNLQVNCCSSFFKYSIYANLDK